MFPKLKKPPFIRVAELSTLVAQGVEITGDMVFGGGMRIDGRVQGNVVGRNPEGQSASLLVLSAHGRIEGSIRCADAVINGIVDGDLDIEHRLELQSEARISGTIRYRQLQIDVGAAVTGQLVKVDEAFVAGNVVELGADKVLATAERR